MNKRTVWFFILIGVAMAVVCFVSAPLDSYFSQIINRIKFKAQLVDAPLPEVLPKDVSLIAVGDVMLSRGVAKKIEKNGEDYPFLEVKDYLKSGDIVFANLETPITEGRIIKPGEMFFRSEPALAQKLKDNNFSIVSLANNHTGNFGTHGLEQTFKYLKEAGIQYAGAGENIDEANASAIIKVNGFSLAFLAYDDIDFTPAEYGAAEEKPGIAFFYKDKITAALATAKKEADFVIVSMHFGNEYQDLPSDKQKELAHFAVDSGADLIIGHHPHVVQPIEEYKGKYIFYSLGNFIFDQMWSEETRQGIAIKIIFNKDGIKIQELKPFLINDYCQPSFLDGEEADKVLERTVFPVSKNKDSQ